MSDDDLALLVSGMLFVIENSRQRIGEYCQTLLKRDAVFCQIPLGLLWVPVELKSHSGQCYHIIEIVQAEPKLLASELALRPLATIEPATGGEDVPQTNTTIHPPLTLLTPDEELFRSSVRRFARERIQPLVRQMDEKAVVSS